MKLFKMSIAFVIAFSGAYAVAGSTIHDSGDIATLELDIGSIDSQAHAVGDEAGECSCRKTKCDSEWIPSCSITCEPTTQLAHCSCADCTTYSKFNMCKCTPKP